MNYMPIEVMEPEVFTASNQVNAFFTLRNGDLHHEGARIKGLNLGFNTEEAPEIVKENRRRLVKAFDLNPEWIAFANQVHSNRVKVVTNGGTFADTDGLITQVPGLALAIQVADCAAVLIADPQSKTIAAVHAGWRGAAGNIVPLTLEKMTGLGATPKYCKAFISPCISLENFEVGQEVADQFPNQFVDYKKYTKPHVNLKGFLRHQLIKSGIRSDHIECHAACTIEGEEQFYSYRREKEKSGRMMAIIQLPEVLG